MGDVRQLSDDTWGLRTEGIVRKGQQLQAHNAVAVRDTVNYDVDVDVSSVTGMKALVVSNGCNQTATVALYAKASNYSFASMGTPVTVSAGGTGVYTDSSFSALKAPIQKITIRVSYSVAPTSGSVNTFIEGISL